MARSWFRLAATVTSTAFVLTAVGTGAAVAFPATSPADGVAAGQSIRDENAPSASSRRAGTNAESGGKVRRAAHRGPSRVYPNAREDAALDSALDSAKRRRPSVAEAGSSLVALGPEPGMPAPSADRTVSPSRSEGRSLGPAADGRVRNVAMPLTAASGSTRTGLDPNAYGCASSSFIDFEAFPQAANLSLYPEINGMHFVESYWHVGRFSSGGYSSSYAAQGDAFAFFGVSPTSGRITFPNGPVSWFSAMAAVSSYGLLQAYDSQGNLVATAGPISGNRNTGTMTELRVHSDTRNIASVVLTSTANGYLWDLLCSDATVSGIPFGQTFGSGGQCNCGASGSPLQYYAGDPVNTATGAFTEQFTDIAVPSTGVAFNLTRSYTSADPTPGPLGQGWAYPFAASASTDGWGNVLIRAEDGQQLNYLLRDDGSFATPPGARSVLSTVTGGGWLLTKPDQSTLTFDSTGRLVEVKDRLGHGLTLAYSGGQLSTVTDAAGRVFTFTFTGSLLTTVALSDGRHVDYGYTAGRLTTVSDLRGKTSTYTYDAGGRLASMTDPNGHQGFLNVYNATTGRVTQQSDARSKVTSFAWNATSQTATRTDPRDHVWTEIYASNVLSSVADPLGNTTSYTYDDRLNRASLTDPRGKTTTFSYDAAGNMLTRTGPAPSSITEAWTYTPFNAIETHTNGRGKTTSYEYFANQLLKKVTDPQGRATSFTWTTDGLLDTITDPRGKVTDFGYDAAGNRTSMLSPEGNLTTFGFDGFARKTSMVEARGNAAGGTPVDYTTTYAYNANDQVTTVTDPLGHATTNSYDDAGNLTTVTDADTNVTTYEYDPANQVTKVTDPRGAETTTTYDDAGNVASVTTPSGETTLSYDNANRRTGEVTPRGNEPGATVADFTWTYGYDATGNQTSLSNPTAGTTTTAFDELNRPTSATDALGKVTTTSYDADSNVVSSTDPLSRVTGYGYDDADQLTSVTDPRGKTTSYGYDASGNRISQTSPLGNQRTWTYDGDGRLVGEVDPRGNVTGGDPNQYKTVSAYDAAGHLLSVTDPEGHTTAYAYNRVGNLTSRTDANSHTTSYGYDAVNRLTSVTDPLNKTITYGYDAVGNLISRTDAKTPTAATTTYGYDLAGRLTQKTAPVTATTNQVWNYGYDAAGNLTSVETPAGSSTPGDPNDGTITQAYDPVDRLIGIDYSDATPDVTYAYNELHRTSMTDGTGLGAETYGYDDAGQLTGITRGTNTFTYGYDNDGRLTSRGLPDGRTITQAWDDDSRPTSVSSAQGSASYGYDPAGDLTSTTFGNTVVETRGYDHTGWLTNVTAKRVNTVIAGHVIVRDNVGNPTDVTHTYNSSTTSRELFSYDAADRVTQVCFATSCGAVSKIAYTYDPVGNRKTEVRNNMANQGTITSTYNAGDQLTSTHATRLLQPALDTTYGYDANGNQTTANDSDGGTRSYAYDLANRTTTATINGTATNYTYDGNGLRLTSTTGTTATSYTWDQNNPLPEMVDETTSAGARQFLNNPAGDPIAETNPGTGSLAGTFYDHPDGIGSIRAVTDANTTIRSTYAYEPFGTPRPSPTNNDTIPNPVRFAGEYTDPNTGRSHLRARDYDPSTGRFTALDPIAQDIHDPYVAAYVYVGNRPTVLVDPSGLCAWYDAPCKAKEAAEKIKDAAGAAVNAAGNALPAIHAVSGVVAAGAGACALIAGASIIGNVGVSEGCAAVAAGAAGVQLVTGAIQYARGDESGTNLALDVLSAATGGTAYGLTKAAGQLSHLSTSLNLAADSSGLIKSLWLSLMSGAVEGGQTATNVLNYLMSIPSWLLFSTLTGEEVWALLCGG